jgi:phage/plasmid-associated DNA primase
LSRKELFDLYENFFVGTDQFVKLWLKDPTIRTYERFDFLPPPLKCPDGVLNTWAGFAAEGMNESYKGKPNMFVEHLRKLFGKNSQYVLKWLANIIQKPGYHTTVALVVVGGQGTGKTTTFELFMKKILGSKYFGQTNNPENDLFSRFGFLKDSKILIVVDDFNVGTIKMNADPFKSYITGETIPFESKGKMSIELLNCANFVLTTNKHDPVKLDADDRRYAVLEVSDRLKGNHAYFSKLYRYLDNSENIRAIYDLLMDIDISKTNFQAERPMTELYQEIKSMSIDKEILFLHHKMGGAQKQQIFKGSDYYQDFRGWLSDNGFTDYKAKDAVRFGLYMKKVNGVTIERRTGNSSYFIIDPKHIPNLP